MPAKTSPTQLATASSSPAVSATTLLPLNAQLTHQSRLLEITLGSISQGIFMIDGDGRVSTFNARVCELLDLPPSRDAGIQVSLDDFGTGYSALSYLQKFDIDYIKIDRQFVRHLAPASTDLALCKAIIVMAHALGLKVIAEGIETALQRQLLQEAGCDYGQGYLFARPMPASELEHMVLAQRGQPILQAAP